MNCTYIITRGLITGVLLQDVAPFSAGSRGRLRFVLVGAGPARFNSSRTAPRKASGASASLLTRSGLLRRSSLSTEVYRRRCVNSLLSGSTTRIRFPSRQAGKVSQEKASMQFRFLGTVGVNSLSNFFNRTQRNRRYS